jgi:DnaJ-class molecular chaperone
MDKYQKLTEARELLQLPERVTMAQIKASYRELLRKWHPDRGAQNRGACLEKTRQIITAYEMIMEYCNRYEYSFSRQEVEKYLSAEEWWYKHFGRDPL